MAGLATFWAISSLLVSYYVYDRSPLYEWTWLSALLNRAPRSWVNIHAGLDQTSESLARIFPANKQRILDIYTPLEMSEPSIQRARQVSSARFPAEAVNSSLLPLDDGGCDTIFLIFVAHELRRHEVRLRFFQELWRALEQDGSIVLVEHLRDWRNVLVYGPGALHFFSRREWLNLGHESRFDLDREVSITPFVRCFVFTKSESRTPVSALPVEETP